MSTIKKILSDSSTTTLSDNNTTDSDESINSEEKNKLNIKLKQLLNKLEENNNNNSCFISLLDNKHTRNLRMVINSDISDSSESEISSIEDVSMVN